MARNGEYCTVAQVAERLGVHPETVRRWAHTGLIPCVLLPSGRMRFDPAEVDRILTPRLVEN